VKRQHRPAPPRRLLACLCALVAAATACGIPIDDHPRALATGGDDHTTGTTTPDGGGDTTTYLYFVKNDRLVDVTREISSRTTRAAVGALFSGPTASEAANGLISQIPPGATVKRVAEANGTIRIEVSKELTNVIGSAALQALGQIVLTVTEIVPASTLEFESGGQPIKVSSPTRGDVSQVSDCDFVSLLPTDDELRAANLSEDSLQHLATRRRILKDRCPSGSGQPS